MMTTRKPSRMPFIANAKHEIVDDPVSKHEKEDTNFPESDTSYPVAQDRINFNHSSHSKQQEEPNQPKKWIRKEKIGQGAQGSVYRCEEVLTGKQVAVKVVNIKTMSVDELKALKNEAQIIKALPCHRHLVQYIKASEKKDQRFKIFMEYVPGGTLSAKIHKEGALSIKQTKRFTRQLQMIHFVYETHASDIKCANVFLSKSHHHVKLGDFGAFKEIGSVSVVGGLKGTLHWMAPEVIREQQTNEGWIKADIWSLGCSVLEMITGHSPWHQYSNPMTAMYQIVSSNKIPTIPTDIPAPAQAFLAWCLQRDPNQRPDTTQLLNHGFLHIASSAKTPTSSSCSFSSPTSSTEATHLQQQAQQQAPTNPQIEHMHGIKQESRIDLKSPLESQADETQSPNSNHKDSNNQDEHPRSTNHRESHIPLPKILNKVSALPRMSSHPAIQLPKLHRQLIRAATAPTPPTRSDDENKHKLPPLSSRETCTNGHR